MDEAGSRTMFVGLVGAFVLYALSFVVVRAVPGDLGRWISIALVLASVGFLGGWFLAVRGGWRLGRPTNRGERRAKEKAREEREKRARLRRF